VKVGIFSDVHANLEALQAVVAFLEKAGCSRLICCGDIVGYGPDPSACLETVRRIRARVVCGNHDAAAVGRKGTADFSPTAAEAIAWTRDALRESDAIYLQNLPLADRFDPFFIVHGSPGDPGQFEYVQTLRDAEDALEDCTDSICLVGHTHHPLAVEQSNGSPARLVKTQRFALRDGARYLINVGSVGQPRDGDPRACCAVYDSTAGEVEFHRLPYNVEAVQAKIRDAGLPEFLATRLGSGR
jgi:diadenosine tetraphosphatase ApaH/serine/threonine PP2A family protein phosphatase